MLRLSSLIHSIPLKVLAPVVVLMIVFGGVTVQAQFYFGKNKVQYTSFDWQVMETEHFRIYFYKSELEIANIAGREAEDSYRALAVKFNHEVSGKTPLIIYSSPSYFSQTNVIPGLLPESVGGFTEFMKGRVVVPFHGSYYDFARVIRHEMVHVFTIDKVDKALSRHTRVRIGMPPLWFTEGLAEFWSKDWDTEADMIIKDMVINGRLFTIPNLYQVYGSYYMYKLGESICHFIEDEYGPDKLTLIFENYSKGRDFNEVIKYTLGDDLKQLSDKWAYSLKKRYFPEMGELGLPIMESSQLTMSGFAVKAVPIRWDDGKGERDWIVYKANRMGYTGIYMQELDGTDKKAKTLLKGERSSDFESLYLLRSGIDAVSPGLVTFSSKSKESDVIYIYDLNEGKVVRRFEFDSLVVSQSPKFSPDARAIVFTGFGPDGMSDLYLLDISSGAIQRLTDDIYSEISPTFDLDGDAVVFGSDRCLDGSKGVVNLFRIDLNNRRITQLTSGPFRDGSPTVTRHGIFFSSNREGTFNIFLLDHEGQLTRQSTYVTGALDPRLTPDGDQLVYTGYQNMGFHIFKMDLKEKPEPVEQPDLLASAPWQPGLIEEEYRSTSMSYDTDYSFDIAQSSVGYDPVYGSLGGFQAAVTDVLGNHGIYFIVTNTARTNDELLESFNFGITYVNREKRINWAIGAFHLYDEYYNDHDLYFDERQAGFVGSVIYPISKFHRVELTTVPRYSKRNRRFGLKDREDILASSYFSWIYDNSLWDITGPLEGRRYNFSIGQTTALGDFEGISRSLFADVRHYWRLGRYSSFANRTFYYTAGGSEPQRIYFGGSWSFRGFARREWYTPNALLVSNELRFPLINNLLLDSPIGGIGFRGIRGALYFDIGNGWEHNEYEGMLGSYGGGFRVALGYVVVFRFDWTKVTDFHTVRPETDFDFFFGWNF